MEASDNSRAHPRKPLIASLLSVVAPGVGHIYCGKLAKGLTLFFLGFVFVPIIVLSTKNVSSNLVLIAVIASNVLLIVVFFYAIFDAWFLARRVGDQYTLKEYNIWYVYALLIVVSLSYPSDLSYSIRENIIEPYSIRTGSMQPSLLVGDHVLLNKTAYNNQSPQIGDLVVFPNPNGRYQNHVKRVVALPGDTVEIKDNVLYINDRPLLYRNATPLTYQKVAPGTFAAIESGIAGEIVEEVNADKSYRIQLLKNSGDKGSLDFAKTTVPNGHCFVLGDNRSNSQDSRHYGPIPLADIRGRVDFIYWPVGSWSRFGRFR
jgi:signal peptidase I